MTLAGPLACTCLAALRGPVPARRCRPSLAVVVGLLPLTTAAWSVLRTGCRPSRTFWAAALTGAAAVPIFALHDSGAPGIGDLYLAAALLVCAAAYAEGGRPAP